MNKLIKQTIFALALTALPVMTQAQVLEAIPDSETQIVKSDSSASLASFDDDRAAASIVGFNPLGSSLGGSSGLVTMPVPDFSEKGFTASFKKGTTKSTLTNGGVEIKHEKEEKIASLRAKVSDKFEVTATALTYERTSDPVTAGLDRKEEQYAIGMKYSERMEDGIEYCIGFNFAPMSAEEMNYADIEQIENMRNVYISFTDKLSERFAAYGSISSAFTKDQELDFGAGVIKKVSRTNIVSGSVGFDCRLDTNASFFSELRVSNYKDIYVEDAQRYRVHAGFRFGFEGVSAEVLGLNLTEDDPTVMVGGSIGF